MQKLAYFIGLSVVIGLLTACSSSDNLEKPAPLVEFTPKIQVSKVWSDSVQGTDEQYINLHIGHDSNTLYVAGYKGKIYAIDAANGEQRWEQKIDANIISGVAVGQNLAVVGTSDGDVIALDINTGKVLWRQSIGNQVLGLADIGKGLVIVKTVAGEVIALANKDGQQKWSYDGAAPELILRGSSQPQIGGNSVVIGFATGKVGKLDIANGNLMWSQAIATADGSFPVQRMIDITASPEVWSGIIYATTYQGNIAALELSTGQVVWNHKLSSYTGLAVDTNNLYVTDAQSHVWKFQQENGGVVWRQQALQARIISAPALLKNYVIVGDGEGYIHWMANNNGDFVAREQLSSNAIQTAPVVFNNTLYVLDVDGHLAAYRVNN
jgi:outer membrane protein assembly factor BamB